MRLWDEEWAWQAGKPPIVIIIILVLILVIIVIVSLLAKLTVTAFKPAL
jgi:hypothetical protein